ncbi:MAG: hypothetical protein IJ204_05900 [Paludibacteraceae bacterium]|nr:hypothetical protein [Paludibacteraceae bacterium]
MKKIYAFLAAALISVCAFASKDQVPSDAVLADYYESGEVCVCIYVPGDMACYDIVLTGSFNGWATDLAKCKDFAPVQGYDGWYVASFVPEETPDATKGIQAKPIMKDAMGNFSWNYQVGAATVIRGGVTVVSGYEGEIDLVNYGTDAPNVYTVDAWKQNPCTAVFHNYTIAVISNATGCDAYTVPFIIGDFNNWNDENNKPIFVQMQIDVTKTTAEALYYYYSFKAAEGTNYQIVSGMVDDNGLFVDSAAWKEAAYLQEFVDNEWVRINNGGNFVTGEEALIEYDIRDAEKYRWARCAPDEREDVVVTLTAPAGAPAEGVDIIGTFDDWKGTIMTLGTDGKYTVTVRMQATDEFKFRRAADATWAVQIQEYGEFEKEVDGVKQTVTDWHDMANQKVDNWWNTTATPKTLEIDLSDPETFRWTPVEQGIENITLTEKAQKVMVDGVLYIVRDNKMFNVQGTQVR